MTGELPGVAVQPRDPVAELVGGRPAGVFVIRGGDVHWRPAIDVNRLSIVLGAVAIAYLLTRARVVKARAA